MPFSMKVSRIKHQLSLHYKPVTTSLVTAEQENKIHPTPYKFFQLSFRLSIKQKPLLQVNALCGSLLSLSRSLTPYRLTDTLKESLVEDEKKYDKQKLLEANYYNPIDTVI